MKLKKQQQQKLNEFVNKYVDKGYKIIWNVIRLSKSDGPEHNRRVCDICVWLLNNHIPFATQVRFKTGYRPDIICPVDHVVPIIEVRASETEKKTKAKEVRIPQELKDNIIYVDAFKEFTEELIN